MVWYIKTNLHNWTIQVKLKFQMPINILVPVFYFLGMAEVPHRNAVLLSTTILFHKINMLLTTSEIHYVKGKEEKTSSIYLAYLL